MSDIKVPTSFKLTCISVGNATASFTGHDEDLKKIGLHRASMILVGNIDGFAVGHSYTLAFLHIEAPGEVVNEAGSL